MALIPSLSVFLYVKLRCVAKYSIAYGKTIIEVPDRKLRNVARARIRKSQCCYVRKKKIKKQGTILFIFLLKRLYEKRDTGHRDKTRRIEKSVLLGG